MGRLAACAFVDLLDAAVVILVELLQIGLSRGFFGGGLFLSNNFGGLKLLIESHAVSVIFMLLSPHI